MQEITLSREAQTAIFKMINQTQGFHQRKLLRSLVIRITRFATTAT
jgi:hypothetical protein